MLSSFYPRAHQTTYSTLPLHASAGCTFQHTCTRTHARREQESKTQAGRAFFSCTPSYALRSHETSVELCIMRRRWSSTPRIMPNWRCGDAYTAPTRATNHACDCASMCCGTNLLEETRDASGKLRVGEVEFFRDIVGGLGLRSNKQAHTRARVTCLEPLHAAVALTERGFS